jgi:benzodiazapine receptor
MRPCRRSARASESGHWPPITPDAPNVVKCRARAEFGATSVTTPTPHSGRGRWKLVVLLLIVCAVAAAGATVTFPKLATWYAALNKPAFNPPEWVFAPVWAALYGLMAVAAWRVWEAPGAPSEKRGALAHFAIQLMLNALWPLVFFGLRRPVSGLIVMLVLLVAVGTTLRRFYLIDRLAGLLLLPYLAWIAFATVLNAAIVGLNP